MVLTGERLPRRRVQNLQPEHPMTTKTKTKGPSKQVTKKKAAKAVSNKPVSNTKTSSKAKTTKLSALSAAAKVLAEAGTAMNVKEMIEAMAAKKYWTSPGGRTPHATLYAAIVREVAAKGKESRFKKTEPGKFAAA
jgi:hypothetical protein